jgi:hypothetical protein
MQVIFFPSFSYVLLKYDVKIGCIHQPLEYSCFETHLKKGGTSTGERNLSTKLVFPAPEEQSMNGVVRALKNAAASSFAGQSGRITWRPDTWPDKAVTKNCCNTR